MKLKYISHCCIIKAFFKLQLQYKSSASVNWCKGALPKRGANMDWEREREISYSNPHHQRERCKKLVPNVISSRVLKQFVKWLFIWRCSFSCSVSWKVKRNKVSTFHRFNSLSLSSFLFLPSSFSFNFQVSIEYFLPVLSVWVLSLFTLPELRVHFKARSQWK